MLREMLEYQISKNDNVAELEFLRDRGLDMIMKDETTRGLLEQDDIDALRATIDAKIAQLQGV